jgi:hypothetical protein
MKKILPSLLAAAFLPLLACGPHNDEPGARLDPSAATPRVSETEKPGLDQPGDINPVVAQARVDDVALGRILNAQGGIDHENRGAAYAAGEVIWLSVGVGDSPAGSAIKAVWTGPNELRLDDQTKKVEVGMSHLTFNAPVTTAWALGDYRVDVLLGDENVATERFTIVPPEEADRG